jgi:hypothetical protein
MVVAMVGGGEGYLSLAVAVTPVFAGAMVLQAAK